MNILKETIEDVGPHPGQFTTTRLWFGCGEFQCEYIRHKIYSLSIGILLTPAFSFFYLSIRFTQFYNRFPHILKFTISTVL